MMSGRSCFPLLLLAAPLLLGAGPGDGGTSAPPACTPAPESELRPEEIRVQEALRRSPGDPMLLYDLAIVHALRCDRPRTLAALKAVAAAPGGLDPGAFRGFAFLSGDPEFRAIVAGIRSAHPPILASQPGFVLRAPGLFPEGMAFDPRTRRVYAGSASGRRIVWTDASGALRVLVPSKGGGLGFPAGMKVDPARDQLWVCSASSFGPGVVLSDATSGLLAFDLRDGHRVRAVTQTTAGFLNDLVVVPSSGEVLATNTSTGAVAVARPGATTTEDLLPAGSVPGANGIALDDRERFLFVAGGDGITRVDLRTRAFQRLERPPDVVDGSFDGLYFHRGTLVGVQNGVHPGRVVRLRLDATLGRIVAWEVLEAYAPWIETPTTGALDGDSLLYLANTQLRRWKPAGNGSTEGLVDVQVRRVALGGP